MFGKEICLPKRVPIPKRTRLALLARRAKVRSSYHREPVHSRSHRNRSSFHHTEAILKHRSFSLVLLSLLLALVAVQPAAAAGGWYVASLSPVAYPYINRTGITQLRLRFQTDDDNDAVADFIRFYSGNAVAANRPVLVIEYYVP